MIEATETAVSVPVPSRDVLSELLRDGARRLLAQAIEAEIDEWIGDRSHLKNDSSRQQVVRNGHLPERKIVTGLGEIEVRQPRHAWR